MSEAPTPEVRRRQRVSPLLLPVLVLAVVLTASFLVIRYAEALVAEASTNLASQTLALSDARLKHSNAGAEKDLIARYLGSYERLQAGGFIGGEQRINWVDGLRNANREADLYGVEYKIDAQDKLTLGSEYGAGALAVKQSPMKITVPLLHETDLMRFLRGLSAQRVGLFSLSGCVLRRTSAGTPNGNQPNLAADCDLAWITVDDSDTKPGAAR